MPDILIRGLEEKTIKRLKARAKRNHRSLQSEAKLAIEKVAGLSMSEALAAAKKSRKKLGRRFEDSVDLIREDRER